MPTDPTPTPTAADIEAARACWLTFAEFPTYIREEKAVHRIASALATAREAGQDVEVGRRRGLIDRARAEGRAESAERIAALQRDAEVAAAAENANAVELRAARERIAALEAALVECSRIGTLAMEEAKHLTHALDVIRADCECAGIPGEVDVPDPDSDDPAPIREWRTTVGLVTIALAQRDTARAAGVREGREEAARVVDGWGPTMRPIAREIRSLPSPAAPPVAGPLTNCDSCAHDYTDPPGAASHPHRWCAAYKKGDRRPDIDAWCRDNIGDHGAPLPGATGCPGYLPRTGGAS